MGKPTADTDAIKDMLELLKAKKQTDDVLRLLDQSEVQGKAWGSAVTMQVRAYESGAWVDCTHGGKDIYSLTAWNKLIRTELAWDGPVRLAVAA